MEYNDSVNDAMDNTSMIVSYVSNHDTCFSDRCQC